MLNKLFMCGALVLGSVSAQASIVPIASDLANEFNNLTGANVFITIHASWALPPVGSNWVSYADTGEGSGSPSNGKTTPVAIFTENFFLPEAVNIGSLDIWAVDTASITLDGSDVGPAADLIHVSQCANGVVDCKSNKVATISLDGLSQGDHALTFSLYQSGGGPTGLLYSGSVDSESTNGAINAVPEPGTILLLGVGLVAVASWGRSRRGFQRRSKVQPESDRA
jgi:PEP-CTERM motif